LITILTNSLTPPFSEEYTLTDKKVLEIAKRFELGDDKTEILKFADAIQAAFMEENQ
jgi:hypothetical protein